MLTKTIETRMTGLSVKAHNNHQSRHTGCHTLIMHLPTHPVNMQACSWITSSSDTSPADHAFIHTSGQGSVMQTTGNHMTSLGTINW